jgi:hypothetical protein
LPHKPSSDLALAFRAPSCQPTDGYGRVLDFVLDAVIESLQVINELLRHLLERASANESVAAIPAFEAQGQLCLRSPALCDGAGLQGRPTPASATNGELTISGIMGKLVNGELGEAEQKIFCVWKGLALTRVLCSPH